MALTTVPGDAGRNTKSLDLGPLTWLIVVVALVATAALAFVVVDGGDDNASVPSESTTPGTGTLLNPGSSNAIEHRALAELRIERASASVSERGSVDAIEHRVSSGAAALDSVQAAERSDRATCLRLSQGQAPCDGSAHRGSPDAIEHRTGG